jgi:cyclase
MIQTRVIPCLLLRNAGLVKTRGFKDPKYLGDPINIVRIFNDKEVDELVFLDITAKPERKRPPFELLKKIASECFMPLCYGGGVADIDTMKALYKLGIEKVAINTAAVEQPSLVSESSREFGASSVIVSIDVKKRVFGGYQVWIRGGRKPTGFDPVDQARRMEDAGAGEILLTSIDRDGTMSGYDIDLVKSVSDAVGIPVVACGGAATIADVGRVVKEAGASAAAAGSMFVFQGTHRAVLVSYPTQKELSEVFAR